MKYFDLKEFNCTHSDENEMKPKFLEKIDELRDRCGFSFFIVSGYRCPWHPAEMKKEKPGTHSRGIAADIRVSGGNDRYILVQKALEMGFTGIGIAETFIHLDTRSDTPVIWSY
tara:strand:- start:1589 stop:1930 length:342 start_codon:yes stop_codon:yes gene_type:complete